MLQPFAMPERADVVRDTEHGREPTPAAAAARATANASRFSTAAPVVWAM